MNKKLQWSQLPNPMGETYMFGSPNRGGGVFNTEKGWEGNAVANGKVIGTGPFDTLKQAQDEVEKEFIKLTEHE
jgi:hypothetical protein